MALNKCGALWLKENKKGNKFMSGEIEIGDEKIYITVFKNSYKKEDKHPDYLIYLNDDEDKEEANNQDDIPF